jgi:hypothetical protein
MDQHQDVTPAQVARDIQACINQALSAMCEISCLAGDEWGAEFEEALAKVHEGLARMGEECDKVR